VPPRQAQTAAALAEVEKRIKDIPGLELRVIHGGNNPTSEASDGGGTRLFSALARGIADLPATRIAGAIVISDGQIHDVPADLDALGFHAPVHLLLSGLPDEADRRLVVVRLSQLRPSPTSRSLQAADRGFGRAADQPSQAHHSEGTASPCHPTCCPSAGTCPSISPRPRWTEYFRILRRAGPEGIEPSQQFAVVLVNGVRDRPARAVDFGRAPCWRARLASASEIRSLRRSGAFHHLRPPEKQDATPINELC